MDFRLNDFERILADALNHGTCIRFVLSGCVRKDQNSPEKLVGRPVLIGDHQMVQITAQVGRQQTHQNFTIRETLDRVKTLLGKDFRHCTLFMPDKDIAVRITRRGRVQLTKSKPTQTQTGVEHNRTKQYLIPDGEPCPFLYAIGVMTEEGKVRAAKYSKFRQVNRFLELVDDILAALPPDETLNIVDFGCGKSYLTFALYHLLTVIRGRQTLIVGLDTNTEVIRTCSRVVQTLGYGDLEFKVGAISDYKTDRHIHLMVSLHACDTATDAAIARAVDWKSEAILAVPCCQHELAPQLQCESLAALLEHGILKERFAALATDALRAKILELNGYQTQVVEFIDMEHTAKNLLIRAVRSSQMSKQYNSALRACQDLKHMLGLEQTTLEKLLGREA